MHLKTDAIFKLLIY